MNQWLKVFVISFVSLFFISCTNNKNSQSSKQTGEASRGIASVSKKSGKSKLRKVVIKRNGFYIDHSSLRPLSRKDQAAYYGIFGNAMMDYERVIRKNKKKYSYNQETFNKVKELFVPKAEAVPCPSAGWVIDNGQSTCTSANWFFRPETMASFSSYRPADSLFNSSLEACQSSGNKMVCPAIGLVVRLGKAMLACTSDSNGFSASCTSQFSDGGVETTVRLLNECETSIARSVDNVTCDELKSSVQRSVKMFSDNCSPTAIKGNSTLNNICGNLQTAVDGVAQKIGEAVNPVTATEMPNVPSCNKLADQVETAHSPVASSSTWNGLLDVARNNCGDLSGKDRNSTALIFGKCKASLKTPDGVDLTELISQYGEAKKSKEPGYIKRFAETFGLTPGRYESLFCDAGNITKFTRRITDDLEGHIEKSKNDLITLLRFTDLKGASGISEAQFDGLKQWLIDNNRNLENLGRTLGSTTVKQAESLITPSDRASARTRVKEAMTALKGKPGFSMEEFFASSILKNRTDLEQLKIRAALASEIKAQVMSPGHEKQMNAAADFLKSCAEEVRRDGKTRLVDGGKFTPDENNFSGCRYVQESDMTGYFENDKDKPYVIFKKGSPGECYEQSGATRKHDTVIGGNSVTVRRIDAKNPLKPSEILTNLTMNNSLFDVGSSETANNPYQLFRYSCTKDIAKTASPFSSSGSEEGSVW